MKILDKIAIEMMILTFVFFLNILC